jgi:hypothetical protein
MSELIVPPRFCGPPDSGNGGWVCGALATLDPEPCPDNRVASWPPIEVTLRQPPPLDAPMLVEVDGDVATASFGGAVIATARPVDTDPVPAEPVLPAVARAAESSYAGLVSHPFPTCFSCGPDRDEADGLRIFPGPVDPVTGPDGQPRPRVAATWTPHPSLAEDWHTYVDDHRRASVAATWAALDCAGAWASGVGERHMVLGRMTARIDTLPVIGEEHVVVGENRGQDGRKSFSATTLYDADGRVVGTTEQVWIAIDPGTFAATGATHG